jgi:hypothetical protein
MTVRRTLVDGLPAKAETSEIEKAFVRGKTLPADQRPATSSTGTSGRPVKKLKRVPFHTRIRDDYADLLKRATLQRQLDGIEPQTMQEIIEEAIEPWLRTNGYLDDT